MIESGIPDLDTVLGGGITAGDLWMIVGAPGAGKTTLVCQVAFQCARAGRRVVFVSTLSEPASRLVKHLRSFAFWDEGAVGRSIFFEAALPIAQAGPDALLGALVEVVTKHRAALLILDGYATLRNHRPATWQNAFVSSLAVAMGALECTTLITSSSVPEIARFSAPEFTICDGLIELAQVDGADGVTTRSLRPWKVRGANALVGAHRMRIGRDGITVSPRFEALPTPPPLDYEPARLSLGVPELDAMMSGGLPRGSSTVLAGAPGVGKTVFALQFLLAGVAAGHTGLLVSFRESRSQLIRKARSFELDLETPLAARRLAILRWAPIELDPDAVLAQVWKQLTETGGTLVVFDSIFEFKRALHEGRKRSVLAALLEALRARGVTALVLRETAHLVGSELDFAGAPLELLAENVILLQRPSRDAASAPVLSVLKMRDSAHDLSARSYTLGAGGVRVSPAPPSTALHPDATTTHASAAPPGQARKGDA